jgi:phosphatidylserine decarboxylase
MTLSFAMYRILPLSLVSRMFGFFTRLPLPKFLLYPLIQWFSKKYGVNTDEYVEPPGGFRTFNQFFTRTLKEGVRPIDASKKALVSPVDARIDQFGRIESGALIQAKGIDYSLEGLIPSKRHSVFRDGDFITLYLSPSDYHRIHSPVDGIIEGFLHVPGKLFTVQETMVSRMPRLFEINERIITFIRTERGMVAVCKVGATNVGRISLSYENVFTNRAFRSKREKIYAQSEMKRISRGQEIGVFNLGSTVIVLFEKNMVRFEGCELGNKVKFGEKIGELLK